MKTVVKFSMLVAIVAIILAVPLTLSAHAYGGRNQQWQVTFSVNCNIASSCGGSGTFGFWGWCEFGGTDPTNRPHGYDRKQWRLSSNRLR